jgi:hypothetical protein
MRSVLRLLSLIPAALLFASCGGEGDPNNSPNSGDLGREYLIGFGETIRVDALTLEFTTVAEESRCPANAYCVWEGNARILLTLTHDRATTVVALNTSRQFPTSATFEGYYVELRRLDPYPAGVGTGPLPQSYEATVFVDGRVSAFGN